jgi:hypothetical protein
MPRDVSANMTEAELDALIAERMPTMPPDGNKCRAVQRADRSGLERVLAGGERLTALQIARRLGITTRGVQQVVCNAIRNTRDRYLSRVMLPGEREYRYFLLQSANTGIGA